MYESMIKAAGGLAVILIAWLLVQRWWVRAMRHSTDQDALAGRFGCGGCDDRQHCHTKPRQNCGAENKHTIC
jgi:hypothetical protein